MKELNPDQTKLEILRKLYDTEHETVVCDAEELAFLKDRNDFELETYIYSFEAFIDNYADMKRLGLDDKYMRAFEFHIRQQLLFHRNDFIESDFYRLVSDHPIMLEIISDLDKTNEA